MSTSLPCWVLDDAFAQGLSSLRSILQRVAGCAPAPAAGQCPAPNAGYPAHSAVDPAGVKSGNRARRGAIEICERGSRARSGGAAEISGFGFVGLPAAARVPPRRVVRFHFRLCWRLICLRSRHGGGGGSSYVYALGKAGEGLDSCLLSQLVEQLFLLCNRQASQSFKQQRINLASRLSQCVRKRQVSDPRMSARCVETLAVELYVLRCNLFSGADPPLVSARCAIDPHESLPGRFSNGVIVPCFGVF